MTLRIATYNVHKGFSQFNRRLVVHELRSHLRLIDADIVFLQEVHGSNTRHAARFADWPDEPQYEFLADQVWPEFAYGRNAVYDHGDHGNALLSRYPIVSVHNQDVSGHRFESRGLLHCAIALPGVAQALHCFCVHLALGERSRKMQIGAVIERIRGEVPAGAPLILAGDFNDWRNRAGHRLQHELGLREAFRDIKGGRPARSFPALFPLLRLDRIYLRGFEVQALESFGITSFNGGAVAKTEQEIIELAVSLRAGRGVVDLAQIEPLPGEVVGEAARLWISEH